MANSTADLTGILSSEADRRKPSTTWCEPAGYTLKLGEECEPGGANFPPSTYQTNRKEVRGHMLKCALCQRSLKQTAARNGSSLTP
jgi:hypothetical protein